MLSNIDPFNNEERADKGDLDISRKVKVMGAGQDLTIVEGKDDRIFDLLSGAGGTELEQMTLRNGLIAGDQKGALVRSTAGLSMTSVTLTNGKNHASVGGALGVGPVNDTDPLLFVSINKCKFKNNTAIAGGAIATNRTIMVISESVFEFNSSGNTGGAIDAASSNLNISKTTFLKNTALSSGGAIYNYRVNTDALPVGTLTGVLFQENKAGSYSRQPGAAIAYGLNSSEATIRNCTFYANYGSSVVAGASGNVKITHITTARNDLGLGFTFDKLFESQAVTFTFANSVFTDGLRICGGSVDKQDGGFNIETGSTCAFGPLASNVDARLDVLRDNGGATKTVGLLSASPAISRVTTVGACSISSDQRGQTRPATGCDAGAFEQHAGDLSVSVSSDQTSTTAGLNLSVKVVISNTAASTMGGVRLDLTLTGESSSFGAAPAGCSEANAHLICEFASLASAESVERVVQLSASKAQQVQLNAQILSNDDDTVANNNQAAALLDFVAPPVASASAPSAPNAPVLANDATTATAADQPATGFREPTATNAKSRATSCHHAGTADLPLLLAVFACLVLRRARRIFGHC